MIFCFESFKCRQNIYSISLLINNYFFLVYSGMTLSMGETADVNVKRNAKFNHNVQGHCNNHTQYDVAN